MKAVVFGGSFDPLHIAHEAVVLDAAKQVDRVLVVPTYQHALKSGYIADYSTRMSMAKAVFDDKHGVIVSTAAEWLWRRQQSTYSYDLLCFLKDLYVYIDEFSLLVGSDILEEAHKWHRWDDLQRDFGIHIVGREGRSAEKTTGKTYPEVSATDIRRRLLAGESVEGLVPEAVMPFLGPYKQG